MKDILLEKMKTIEKLIKENKFSSAINDLNEIIDVAKSYHLKDIIKNARKKINLCKSLKTKKKLKDGIKKKVLELGTKFGRLHITEIAEECNIKDERLILAIIEEMINNKEIYAQYFSSTKSVAFNQQINNDTSYKLDKSASKKSKKICTYYGKKIDENAMICPYCGS